MLTGKAAVLTPAPFWTVIAAEPGAAISPAGTVARSTELDTWLVAKAAPVHLITAFGANDSPNAVSVKALPPSARALRESSPQSKWGRWGSNRLEPRRASCRRPLVVTH